LSDLKLFSVSGGTVREIPGSTVALERSLQVLIERNLETFLGVRFLASEFATDAEHGGRMDTLGIDENNCPVIIEYKRSSNDNVINQGLFYLDWLVKHRGDFEMLVMKTLGRELAEAVEWSAPRLLCIAGSFNKFDEHAIKQMNRNIELIRYVRFGDELLLLDQVNKASSSSASAVATPSGAPVVYKTVSDYLAEADQSLIDLYESLKEFLLNLGDDVETKVLKFYIAFKRIKNFACVEIAKNDGHVKVDPDSVELEAGFTRDVRNVGHFGTGDLEIRLRSLADLERAKPLLIQSYESA